MKVAPLELWGGIECSLTRVGDRFRDQLAETGHDRREGDLDLAADLGFAAMRYPILWERIAPEHPERRDWHWTDRRLATLRRRGVRPIAGLVHHGSGPRYTNLLADDFASGLADHARAAAERYPWIDDWTPVNEPVTTARFAALYGHWYPHARDERLFWLALLNQIDATRAAMAAIRAVNPAARLIQTDDLGRTFATATLRDQAAFDNVRRWASWDLLCGMVTKEHPLWRHLAGFGFGDRLRRIAGDPCPPDIVGVNHYLTSDRFLDHRSRRYPAESRGGNGRLAYADVAAVRVLDPPPPGIAGALREAWRRYGRPVALTEVHNGCTRDEQLRWADEAWRQARRLRREGVDVRAVTLWSLFGCRGWDRLLTADGRYEAGLFDASDGTPRPTATAALAGAIAGGTDPAHPVLAAPGWWRRPIRHLHPIAPRAAPMRDHAIGSGRAAAGTPPLLIVASGERAAALAAACAHRAIPTLAIEGVEFDLATAALIDRHRPWAVVDSRPSSGEAAMAACAARGLPLIRPTAALTTSARLSDLCDALLDRAVDERAASAQR